MRFLSRFLLYFIGGAALLLLALNLSIKYFLPTQMVQDKITSLVSSYTHGEVKIKRVSAGIMGIDIGGISLVTPKGETILSADNIDIKISPFKLLKGEIDFGNLFIDNLQANIVKNADGTFNFEGLLVSQEEKQPKEDTPESENNFLNTFKIRRLQIKDCSVYYKDIPGKSQASLKNLFFDIYDFSFIAPFQLSLNADASYEGGGISIKNIPLGLTVNVDLKALNLEQATANIPLFIIERGQSTLNLQGTVNNFQNPEAELNLKALRLAPPTIAGIADIGEFSIDNIGLFLSAAYDTAEQELTIKKAELSAEEIIKAKELSIDNIELLLEAVYDIDGQKLTIKDADISALGSSIEVDGWLVLDDKLKYEANIKLSAALERLGQALEILKEYKLTGSFVASANVKNDDIKGILSLKNIGLYCVDIGKFTKLNGTVEAKSLKHILLNSLTGYLDGNLFKTAANYQDFTDRGDFNFNFKADKLVLNKAKAVAEEPSQPIEEPVLADKPEISPEVAKVWIFPPLNIQGAVNIGQLQTPFLNTSDLDFEIDIKSFTPDLSKVGGRLSLDTKNGRIKDLYKLTNANAVTKVLFVSLGVVSKVINSLDVLALLNTLSAAVLPSDKQEEVLESSPEKIETSLEYDKFNIALSFKDGLTDIEKGYFVSSMLSFNLDGDINFATRKIAMFVNAAPGRHQTGGIMPLKLNVGGTLDEPKGSMSMLSSAANMISQSVFNNAGSRLVKEQVGGILVFFGIGSKSKKAKKAAADKAAEDEFIPLELPEDPSALAEELAEIDSKTSEKVK